jgi:hypothetical protein
MLGKAHIAIGASLGAIAAHTLVGGELATYWLVAATPVIAGVAAGLPDVLDSENAAGRAPLGISWDGIKRTAQRREKSLVEMALLIPRVILALIVDVIAALLPHRGLTHWLMTTFLLSLLLALVALWANWPLMIPLAFGLGYLSHLLADGMTVSGVPYLGPLFNEPMHLLPKPLRFRYDHPAQWLVVLALFCVTVIVWQGEINQVVHGKFIPGNLF